MPVFNGGKYVRQAIESILAQVFRDFEFIIVNDGSTDDSLAVIRSCKDYRTVLVERSHQGLIASLNAGLAIAKGEYIARMDSDDISLPTRIEKQVHFLDHHKDVGIVGTACQIIDDEGRELELQKWPCSDVEIRWSLLLTSPFAHPTVIFRRALLEKKAPYDSEYKSAEDYDLWARLLNDTRGANLSKPLMKYRRHTSSITANDRSEQLLNHDLIAFRTIKHQLPNFGITRDQIQALREIFVEEKRLSRPASDLQLIDLFPLYLAMFDSYICQQSPDVDLETLKREEMLRIARCLIRHSLYSGSSKIIRHMYGHNPWLPLQIVDMGVRFIGRQLRRHWIH